MDPCAQHDSTPWCAISSGCFYVHQVRVFFHRQATLGRICPERIAGGQSVSRRERQNPFAINVVGGSRDDDQTSLGLLRECCDRRFDVVSRIMKMDARYFDMEIRCRILSRPKNRGPCLKEGIRNTRDSSEIGRSFLEQRQPLAAHFRLKCTEPGNVAARAYQTLDETATDRIGNNDEYDRDGAGRQLHCGCRGRGVSQDHVWRLGCQLFCEGSRAIGVASAPEIINLNVATLCPS